MTCSETRDRFSELLDGDLDDKSAVEAHLQGCAACRLEWERFQRTVGAVRSLPQHPAPEGFASGVLEGIQRAELLAQPQVVVGWQRWSRPGFLIKGLAAAAILLIVVRLGTSPKAPEPRSLPQAPAAGATAEFHRSERETLDSNNSKLLEQDRSLSGYSLSAGGKPDDAKAPAAVLPDGTALAWILPARQVKEAEALALDALEKARDDKDDAVKDGEPARARGLKEGRWDQHNADESGRKLQQTTQADECTKATKAKEPADSLRPRTLTLRVPVSKLPQVTRRLAALGARPLPSPAPQNACWNGLPVQSQGAALENAKNLHTVMKSEEELARKKDVRKEGSAESEPGKIPENQEALDKTTATSELAEKEEEKEPWVTLTLTLEDEPEPEKVPEPTQSSEQPSPP